MTFDPDEFDSVRFRKQSGFDEDTPLNVTSAGNTGRSKRKEHAHLELDITGKRGRLSITFHPRNIKLSKKPDANLPPIEDRISDLAMFFKHPELTATTTSRFSFHEKDAPNVFLGYPANFEVPILAGAIVSGQEVTFPKSMNAKKALTTLVGENVIVVVNSVRPIDLGSFHVEGPTREDYLIALGLISDSETYNAK